MKVVIVMYLNNRAKDILLNSINNISLTVEELSIKYEVSKRTIYKDLAEIKKWLKKRKVILKTSPVVHIDYSSQYEIEEIKKELGRIKPYITPLTQSDRIKMIIIYILTNEPNVKIATTCDKVGISRSTFYRDLEHVEEWFSRFSLDMVIIRNRGIQLKGEENKKREAILNFFKSNLDEGQILTILQNNESAQFSKNDDLIIYSLSKSYFKDSNIEQVQAILREIENLQGYKFCDSQYASLLVHIEIAIKRIKNNYEITMDNAKLEEIKSTLEFNLAQVMVGKIEKAHNIKINEAETGYIALHLISSKIKQKHQVSKTNKDLEEQINKFINNLSRRLKKPLALDSELIESLKLHMHNTYKRLNLGMNEPNPLREDIMQQYGELFQICKDEINNINLYGKEFGDDEIAYIVIYIAATLERNAKLIKNVYIVCTSGMGSVQLLLANLKNKTSNINVVDILSMNEAEKLKDSNVDAIISTVYLENPNIPVIVVNPFLTYEDIKKINNELNLEPTLNISFFKNKYYRGQNQLEIMDFMLMLSDVATTVSNLIKKLKINLKNEEYMGLVMHLMMQINRDGNNNFNKVVRKDSIDNIIHEEISKLSEKYDKEITKYDLTSVKSYFKGREGNN